jgi:hypothetical protein
VFAIVGGLLIVGGAIATYFLTRGPEESPYRVAAVTKTTIVKEVRVTGHLELTDEVEVPAPIEGQLVEVFVQPGDSVEVGQLLAQLDKGSAEIAFGVAQAELEIARARVSEAEANVRPNPSSGRSDCRKKAWPAPPCSKRRVPKWPKRGLSSRLREPSAPSHRRERFSGVANASEPESLPRVRGSCWKCRSERE